MPRPGREPPRRIFQGRELTRLMSMIFMLVVLFLLMQRARAPETWRWLVGRSDGKNQVVGKEQPSSGEPGNSTVHRAVEEPGTSAGKSGARLEQNTSEKSRLGGELLAEGPAAPAPKTAAHPSSAESESASDKPVNATPAESEPASGNSASGDRPANAVASKIPPATGPTDEDLDEAGGALEDFDGINDGTIGIEKVEMPAYERLVRWVMNQPEETLAARANRMNPAYGEFLQSPEACRAVGNVYEIDLNIRRMDKFDAPIYFRNSDEDPHPPVALWDLWGANGASAGRLYQLVVFDPPEGMPFGYSVDEDVRFVGYFFKLQGYEPNRALPGHKLLNAPTFIGRIVWKKRPPDVGIQAAEWLWVVLVGGAALLGAAIWGSWLVFGKRKHNVAQVATDLPIPASITIDEWLDHAQADDADSEHETDRDMQATDDGQPGHTNGHANGHGAKDLFSDEPDGGQQRLN